MASRIVDMADSSISVHKYHRLSRTTSPQPNGMELLPLTGTSRWVNGTAAAMEEVPIEERAMSAAALRAFTRRCVAACGAQAQAQATEEGKRHLEGKKAQLSARLEAAEAEVKQLASGQGRGGVGGGGFKEAKAAAERLRRKLQLVEADLAARQGRKPYMTTRDVHKYIIKPETDPLLCRYVELPQWCVVRDLKSIHQPKGFKGGEMAVHHSCCADTESRVLQGEWRG